jgi:hypothetical protein
VNPPGVWAPFGAFSMAAIQGAGPVVRLYHPDLVVAI